jgi:hypothetical protein
VAYLRPNAFQRKVFNPIARRLGMGGSEPLVVRGRRTGEPLPLPVIPVEHDGARYIVSTRGEAEWVRNLRAAGGRGEIGGRPFRATEIGVEQRPPLIEAYRAKAGRVVEGYWEKLPDPEDHPVFRIDPAEPHRV